MNATSAARRATWLLGRATDTATDVESARQTAFADLYRAHGSGVYGFLRFRVGDPTVAEDLTAEVFARAWAKFDNWR